MALSRQWRLYRPSRVEILSYGASVLAIFLYFAVLHVLDGRAETYFRELRESNPQLYLTQLRESRGFETYLETYRTMEGYDSFKPAAPSFLVGRWTMRPAPLRLTPGTAPNECSNPVTFDYGIILLLESGGGALPVTYEIENQSVLLKAAQIGTFTVNLVSYGADLDHIEFRPPGRTDIVYAYNCGR